MKCSYLALPLLFVLTLLFGGPPPVWAERRDASMTETQLASDAAVLASDAYEGRGVGTKGLDKAADYVAAEFKRIGLKTDLFDGQPFQTFSITVSSEMGPKEKNRLSLKGPAEEGKTEPTLMVLNLDTAFRPLAVGGSGVVEAPLVFVGYGITDKEHNYDEYAEIDVEDKVVLVLRKEPQQADAKSIFNGTNPSQHATFMRKLANAYEHGAKAVILVNDAYDLESKRASDEKAWREEVAKFAAAAAKFTDGKEGDFAANAATEINQLAESITSRAKRLAAGYDELVPFNGAGEESGHKTMPVWFCRRAAIEPIAKQATGKTLAEIEQAIDGDLKPRSQALKDWLVQGEAAIVQQQAEVKNVLAVLEGEGPLADETIVIGAHYDHVGWGGPGSLAPWTHEVHNGADDNASGTATLLEVARRLSTAEKRPSRRIVFMAFTGEERGLLGSAYYCRNPRFPLDKTVAMINMDMVGRLVENKLIVYGTGTATQFDGLVNDLGVKDGFQVTKHEGGFGPSDHASFYAQKIPVLHLFTGNHNDYHRPSDDVEKLNIPGMRRVAEFVVDLVNKIDASSERPTYLETKKIEHIGDGGDRPYFGSIPDYSAENVEGLKLTGVVQDGPAAKGGLQGGDTIIGLGESKIGGIEDFDSALRKFKPGDRVKVKVRRGDATMELDVVLGKRPG